LIENFFLLFFLHGFLKLISSLKNMTGRIKTNKYNTEIIKSLYDYKMQVRMKALEQKINKLYKLGLVFWAILGIIILFFILMMIL